MSAFIVDPEHVGFLVRAGITLRIEHNGPLRWTWNRDHKTGTADFDNLCAENATAVGQMLWDENVRSVGHRYQHLKPSEMPGAVAEPNAYRHDSKPLLSHPEPVAVLKAIDCYEYQACETPDWPQSQAFAFCEALRSRAICSLPGYAVAAWEVTGRPSAFEAVRVTA